MRHGVRVRKWWPFYWYCCGCFRGLSLPEIQESVRRDLPVRAWVCEGCGKAERYRRPPLRLRPCIRCGERFRIGRTAMLCPECFATAEDWTRDFWTLADAGLGVAVGVARGSAPEP